MDLSQIIVLCMVLIAAAFLVGFELNSRRNAKKQSGHGGPNQSKAE